MKQKQYIEPIGFKGQKGKWKYRETYGYLNIETENENLSVISDWDINEDRSVGIFVDQERERANFLLLTQSKELAKALQDMIVALVGIMPTNVQTNNPIHMTAYHALHNAKQVLKEAGLTDK